MALYNILFVTLGLPTDRWWWRFFQPALINDERIRTKFYKRLRPSRLTRVGHLITGSCEYDKYLIIYIYRQWSSNPEIEIVDCTKISRTVGCLVSGIPPILILEEIKKISDNVPLRLQNFKLSSWPYLY